MDYLEGKINLDRVFSENMHMPTRREDSGVYALYPHKDESEVGKRMQRSDAWHREVRGSFNSPSNIRMVCFDETSAYVSYWNAPLVNGVKKSVQEPIKTDYQMNGVRVVLDPRKVLSDKLGFGCLIRDYVSSNIEELWVTVEAFGVAARANPAYQGLYNQLQGLPAGSIVLAEVVRKLIEMDLGRNLRTAFPLLRSIVVVHRRNKSIEGSYAKYVQRTDSVVKYLNETYPGQRRVVGDTPELLNKIAQETGFSFAVCPIKGADMTKFRLGDYKYDEKYLVSLREAILDKYARTGQEVKKQESGAASEKERSDEIAKLVHMELSKILKDKGYEIGRLERAGLNPIAHRIRFKRG